VGSALESCLEDDAWKMITTTCVDFGSVDGPWQLCLTAGKCCACLLSVFVLCAPFILS
jgi:hypothetical protein